MTEIAVKNPFEIRRDSPTYHRDRLRVTLSVEDLRGHRLIKAGKFVLAQKRLAPDGKIIMRFDSNGFSPDKLWDRVATDGVIKIPLDAGESRRYMEGSSYLIFLYTWA